MLPIRQLYAKFNVVNLTNEPSTDGIIPVEMALFATINLNKVTRMRRVPFKLLACKFKFTIFVNNPIVEGIVPT